MAGISYEYLRIYCKKLDQYNIRQHDRRVRQDGHLKFVTPFTGQKKKKKKKKKIPYKEGTLKDIIAQLGV